MANAKAPKETSRDIPGDALREKRAPWGEMKKWFLPTLFGLMVVALGLTVAVIINPAVSSQSLPISEQDVGKVAQWDIRAPINFSVPDLEATERKRAEAQAVIMSVYDFKQNLGAERVRLLTEAFGMMQKIVAENQKALTALDAYEVDNSHSSPDGPKKPLEHKTTRLSPREKKNLKVELGKERAKLKAALEHALDEKKGQFLKVLQVVIDDRSFVALKADRFSVTTLKAISSLVEKNMRHMIVKSRELLAADRRQGITVRYLRDGVVGREVVVSLFTRILDMQDAADRVEQSAALELADVPGRLRSTIVRVAQVMIMPNLYLNRKETSRRKQEARDNVESLEISYKKNEVIVRSGEKILRKHIAAFRQMSKLTEVSNAVQMAIGTMLLVSVMLLLVTMFSAKNIHKFRTDPKDLGMLALVMFVSLVSVKTWFWIFGAVYERFQFFPLDVYYFAIPFAAGAMLVRFVLNSEMALAFTAVFAVLSGLVMDANVGWIIYCLVSSLVAASAVGHVRQRTSLLYAGALTGLANMVLAVALSLHYGTFFSVQTLLMVLFAFSGGFLAAIIVAGIAPLIEVAFGYTTDIKLLELANLNHPLLKDLIVQAPGSYHHSIIVGSLVEAAAESTRCNPLLARVMAYYHDIGKIKKPQYFSENQRDGINRHDKLKPSLSASVLRAHVKDGAELARKYRLGKPIEEAILQHHGTSLMKFFFQRAKDQAEEQDAVNEEDFRYPGPKPQSRETALVMLADSVEAAAKSISDPSPARLRGLVQNMINRIFVDGQLDECDLTLQDLHHIARAFNRVLAGIYHSRPDYPEPATKDTRAQHDTHEQKAVDKKGDQKNSEKGKTDKNGDQKPQNKKKPDTASSRNSASVDDTGKNGKKGPDGKREETPDEGSEDIKRLGI